jgi:signal transduction histidine kinase
MLHRDFSVASNPGHLDQLVINLLANALKFSPENSPVEVEIDDGQLRVRDFGPGIESPILERIGEPFNLGSSSSHSKVKGHGLGLAWISTVSKLYDWELEFVTAPSGTEVIVRFPPIE